MYLRACLAGTSWYCKYYGIVIWTKQNKVLQRRPSIIYRNIPVNIGMCPAKQALKYFTNKYIYKYSKTTYMIRISPADLTFVIIFLSVLQNLAPYFQAILTMPIAEAPFRMFSNQDTLLTI
jgi:hypothetical protein